MRTRIPVVFLALLCAAALLIGPGLASGEFEMQFDDAIETIDVPPQEITVEGDTFTVSTIGQVEPGERIVVDATPPSDESYTVYLYTSDGNPEDFKYGEGPGTDTLSFETARLDPGSYTVVLSYGGRFQTIAPVAIAAYEYDSIGAPTSVEPGESFEISATLSEIESEPIERVEVVIWNGNSRETFEMDEDGDLEYSTTVDGLDEGEYETYLNVRGTDEVSGTNQQELLAVSEGPSISVETAGTNGGSGGTGDGGAPDGEASDGDQTDDGTPTPDGEIETPTPTPTDNQTQTSTPESDETATQTPETTETETGTPDSTSTEEPDGGPITPNVDTPQPEEQPGFGAFLAVGALAVAARLLMSR